MTHHFLKSGPFRKENAKTSFSNTSSEKKLIEEFRYEPENDSRHSLQPMDENFNIPSSKTRRRPEQDDFSRMSIAELNGELEANSSQMMNLINRRKQLLQCRKQKLKEEYQQRGGTMGDNEEMRKISCYLQYPQKSKLILQQLIRNIVMSENKKHEQDSRSRQFWVLNKKYESDVDIMLAKLKQVDHNLQSQSADVANICKSLDSIQDTLKEVVLKKSDDQMKKAEPLFISKKKTEEILSAKVAQKQRIKDQKIEHIKSIKSSLMQLKQIRDQRIEELYHMFGIEEGPDPEQSIDFILECNESFEELVRMRDISSSLDIQERQANHQLDNALKNEEGLCIQLMRRQSDEAKSFQNYYSLVLQKSKYNGIFQLFGKQFNTIQRYNLDTKQILNKHKVYKEMLRSLLDEDKLLKQALVRTNETYHTFSKILQSSESQKYRRKELLNILQSCVKLKHQQQEKKDSLRTLNVQSTKMNQRKDQIEDELQNIMTDGDLQSYKKIGQAMNKCQMDIERLNQQKRMLESEIDCIDKQIISIAESFKNDYSDITKDILPRDFEFSFKSSDDVKQVKNYIRKTYRRLGLDQDN